MERACPGVIADAIDDTSDQPQRGFSLNNIGRSLIVANVLAMITDRIVRSGGEEFNENNYMDST
jgi:hypothetical protein